MRSEDGYVGELVDSLNPYSNGTYSMSWHDIYGMSSIRDRVLILILMEHTL